MSEDVATSEKNRIKIMGRDLIDYFYRGLRKFKKLTTRRAYTLKEEEGRAQPVFCIYPRVHSWSRLEDLLHRFRWYLPGLRKGRYSLSLSVSSKIHSSVKQNERYSDIIDQIHLTTEPRPKMNDGMTHLLIHRFSPSLFWDPFFLKWLERTTVVDPYYFSFRESGNYALLEREVTPERVMEQYLRKSRERFRQIMKESSSYEESILFCTGPSVEQTFEMGVDFPAKFTVICNSMVKNHDMLDIIQPDVLVFADPVFHFGCSEYAQTFREEMIETVRKYDLWVVIPLRHMPLLLAHHSELKKNVIGMPLRSFRGNFHFPTPSEFFVYSTNNILTRFMIPIASSITDRIYLIGSDGRDPDEDYFWKHNSKVQYEGLKKTAFETHPSFFRDRIYSDYYREHCKILKKMIEYGEEQGRAYWSLTPSKIPVLKERRTNHI